MKQSRSVLRYGQPETVSIPDRAAALRILRLEANANPSRREIKRAFRREVLQSHPDLPGGSAQRFLEVKAAYELLTGRAIASAVRVQPRGGPPPFTEADLKYRDIGSPDPADLEDVWREIGYNPYTGETLGQQDDGTDEGGSWSWASEQAPAQSRREGGPSQWGVRVTRVQRPPQDRRQDQDPKDYTSSIPVVIAVVLAVVALISFAREVPEGPDVGSNMVTPGTNPVTEPLQSPPVPKVRMEVATSLEYGLALSAAKAENVPVLIGGVSTSAEMLQAWLDLPEQRNLQALFPTKVGPRDPGLAQDGLLEQLWMSQGRLDRMRYFMDGLLSALYEPKLAITGNDVRQKDQLRFKSVLVVAEGQLLTGIVNGLMDQDMQLVNMETAQPWQPGTPYSATKSGRLTMRLLQPITGQDVVLIGTTPLQQTIVTGAKVRDPLGRALPQLRELIQRAQPDLVVVDLSRPALQEVCKEMSQLAGVDLEHGVQLLDPTTLQAFQPPPWASSLEP